MSLKLRDTICNRSSLLPMFILCDKCYWCATYIDNSRTPVNNNCPRCNDNIELSVFPITSNESFTSDYNEKRRTELQFNSRYDNTDSTPI